MCYCVQNLKIIQPIIQYYLVLLINGIEHIYHIIKFCKINPGVTLIRILTYNVDETQTRAVESTFTNSFQTYFWDEFKTF